MAIAALGDGAMTATSMPSAYIAVTPTANAATVGTISTGRCRSKAATATAIIRPVPATN
nr:hypothetical protein [Nakamurella aerolata]